MNWQLFNVIFLGLAFMLLFTAFQTASMSAKFITDSLKRDLNMTTNLTQSEIDESIGDGYISISVVYAVFALSNFFSSAIVKLFGHKAAMFVSALAYLLYIVMYLYPTPLFMYTSSAILGIGAAVIWTAQGNFLHLQSSDEDSMSKNTGIFWCMFQCSLLIGTLYIYFAWEGVSYVDTHMKNLLFTGLSILAGIGTGMFLLLKAPFCGAAEAADAPKKDKDGNETGVELIEPVKTTDDDVDASGESAIEMIVNSIIESFKLLATRKMILLAPLFIYSGFSLSFFSGIYVTSIGNTNQMPEHTRMLGLVGAFIGLGQVFGGGIFVFGSKLVEKVSRIMLLNGALLLHLISFAIVIMNIPANANIEATDGVGVFVEVPNRTLALAVAVMLGLGDAAINNVIYSTVSTAWKDESASAFALMKCLQSSAAAISFGIAALISLWWHISILVVIGTLTCVTFISLRRSMVQTPY